MNIIKQLALYSHGRVTNLAHSLGLTTGEKIVIGGYRYPVADFMGFSDKKITDLLSAAGADSEQVELTFVWLEGLGRKRGLSR